MNSSNRAVAFICQSYDASDKMSASAVAWANSFSINNIPVEIITLRSPYSNENLHVIKGSFRFITVFRLYKATVQFLTKYHNKRKLIFIYQGGFYSLLLYPLHFLFKFKMVQWKAHPKLDLSSIFSHMFCNKIYTSTESAFPFKSDKVCIIGQHVDFNLFKPLGLEADFDIIIAGRISKTKRIEYCFNIIERLNVGTKLLKVCVVGPIADHIYYSSLVSMAQLSKNFKVDFIEGVDQSELPTLYCKSRVMLNCAHAAIDRTAMESLACGIPVFTNNICLGEFYSTIGIKEKFFSGNDEELISILESYLNSPKHKSQFRMIDDKYDLKNMANKVNV